MVGDIKNGSPINMGNSGIGGSKVSSHHVLAGSAGQGQSIQRGIDKLHTSIGVHNYANAGKTQPVDSARVSEIRQAISNDTYNIDTDKIASQLVKWTRQVGND